MAPVLEIPAPAAGAPSSSYNGATQRELNGGEQLTTNNRMELMAAIMALEALKRPCPMSISIPTRNM
jgi:ribonuclease HI